MEDLHHVEFHSLPNEVQKLLVSWLNLDLRSALRLQVISKTFKQHVWETLISFNCALVTESAVQPLLDRVNPAALLNLDLSRRGEALGSEELFNLRKQFPNLVTLAVKFKKYGMNLEHIKHILEEQSGSLAELAFYGEAPELDHIKSASRTLRVIINNMGEGIRASNFSEEDMSTINFNVPTVYVNYQQQDPIQIQQNVTCGSSLGDYTLIGTESGTLYIYKDTKSDAGLVLERVVSDVHSERINSITLAHDQLVVASTDGFVSAWVLENSEEGSGVPILALKTQIQFYQPIYYAFYHKSSEYYLAASKRTVFIHHGSIINSIQMLSDITGVYLTTTNSARYFISTEYNLYVLDGPDLPNYPNPKEYAIPASTVSFSPDESLAAIASNTNQINLYDAGTLEFLMTVEGFCDCQPDLVKYDPTKYIIAYTNKGTICLMNLESKVIVGMYTPRLSKKEIMAQKKLVCKSLWYSADGLKLFGLYSDNKLHYWHHKDQ